MLKALILLASVATACLGQFILRIRPPAEGMRASALYLVASLLCYGASFGITASILPEANRKVAVLVLSLQYPMLYLMFAIKDGILPNAISIITISLGYALVAAGMFGGR